MNNTNMRSVNRVCPRKSDREESVTTPWTSISDLRRPHGPLRMAASLDDSRAAKRCLRRFAGLVHESNGRSVWFRLRWFLFRFFDFAPACVFVSHATQHATISYLWRHFEKARAMVFTPSACVILDANRGRALWPWIYAIETLEW